MFPGMDKRSMEAAMRKLGVQQDNIDAEEVVIKLKGGNELVISSPSVAKISMMGQVTFQVSGQQSERSSQRQLFSEEDVKTVVAQTGVSDDEAKAALARANGDLAAAIIIVAEKE